MSNPISLANVHIHTVSIHICITTITLITHYCISTILSILLHTSYIFLFISASVILCEAQYLHVNMYIYMSQAQKSGYEIDKSVFMQLLKLFKLFGRGCWQMNGWVGMTLLCMCKVFFHQKREADDCDVILVTSKSSVYVGVRSI